MILAGISSDIYAQRDTVMDKFHSLPAMEKVEYYLSLPDSLKLKSNNHFSATITASIQNTSDLEVQKKLQLALADSHRVSGNYIQGINVLKGVLANKSLQLTASDSVDVLDHLKRSYYSLYLYPEIFEINAQINTLIERGASYPLWTYNMNSKLYANLNQYDKAAFTLTRELRKVEKYMESDPLLLPSGYNDLGYYFYKAKQYDSAMHYFNQALAIAERWLKQSNKEGYEVLTATTQGNIGAVYVAQQAYEKAIPLLLYDVNLGLKRGENKLSMLLSMNLVAHSYLQRTHLNEAKEMLDQIEPILQEMALSELNVDFFKNMGSYHYKINQPDIAQRYYEQAFEIKKELEERDKSKILGSNEMVYALTEERKVLAQQRLSLKNKALVLKNRQKQLISLIALVLSLLLLLSGYSIYRLKKQKREIREKNKEISAKNEQIANALQDKNLLLKEVHHRVKNNLQVISGILSIEERTIKDERIKKAFREGQNRIQSIALVHRMMYQSDAISKVVMQEYLEALVSELSQSFALPHKKIETLVDAKTINFDIKVAVPIGLIVNEAVCNAYKHAFTNQDEGKIIVRLTATANNTHVLSINDNGKGGVGREIPSDNVGLELIEGLTAQLKGKLTISSDQGTIIKIQFV